MANTTFANLKINLLRLAGNQYNASDTTKLQLAGNSINRALGIIQGEIKGHPYTLDTGNTVTAVIISPYGTPLVDTDIIDITSVSERSDPNKLKWIPYEQYLLYMADPSRLAGIPSLMWTALQTLNVSGQNIWTLYFIPTPSTAITIYYDYEKNLLFSSDGTAADAAFSPFPTLYDGWIIDEAKPFIYEILDYKNQSVIAAAYANAEKSRKRYREMMLTKSDGFSQVSSIRDRGPMIVKRVETTTAI